MDSLFLPRFVVLRTVVGSCCIGIDPSLILKVFCFWNLVIYQFTANSRRRDYSINIMLQIELIYKYNAVILQAQILHIYR